MEKIEIKRCAVYVRKSTEQGLEQQYNSLDAQRDSALAYIKSQEANGWQFTKEYRDGGFSGGNINRPALHELIADIKAGKEVALCSDGGYPGISDPGYRLIRTCAKEGVPYEVIPGASAVNVALLMSGLSTSSFTFRGFPPRGPGALRNWFAEDADKEHTLICYESPFRIAATLEAALDALGDREAAVCIELTKLHERVSRGYLSDLVREFKDAKVKGEVALVIAGNNPKFRREG